MQQTVSLKIFFLRFNSTQRVHPLNVHYNIMTDEERECENGEVKIQGWTGSSNGYVEFCQNKRWTGVCNNDGWDNLAKVVCRQLGFDPNGIATLFSLVRTC